MKYPPNSRSGQCRSQNGITLSRNSGTLSGGESQRIRLASQIGSGLTGVLYVLDEPSIGLHQRDNGKLLESLNVKAEKGDDGAYTVTPEQLPLPIYFRFAHKYAYVTVRDRNGGHRHVIAALLAAVAVRALQTAAER